LRGIDLTLFENEITTLLGENGAGKTTTLNCLAGILKPSAYGMQSSNRKDKEPQRGSGCASTTYCEQTDNLYSELTVREQLRFIAKLRSVEFLYADLLKDLNVPPEIESRRCCELSGGWRRVISCASAFLGNPRFVILDEPTAGMDPHNRRLFQKFLLKRKQGRCVLLTTHLMDEAEVVSDKVAILKYGVIKTCGSVDYLKTIFGTGFSMQLQMRERKR
ncbi:unnamed protein product, partial [Amoebophrya sp. A25]